MKAFMVCRDCYLRRVQVLAIDGNNGKTLIAFPQGDDIACGWIASNRVFLSVGDAQTEVLRMKALRRNIYRSAGLSKLFGQDFRRLATN